MELEADLFLTFQGWGPRDTAAMFLDELIHWHKIADERRESDD